MKKNLGYLLPAVLFTACFFLYGLYDGFLQSVGLNPLLGEAALTGAHYGAALGHGDFPLMFFYTLKVSFVAAALSLACSLAVLFLLYCLIGRPWVGTLVSFFCAPLAVPYLIASYMIFILLMERGLLGRVLPTGSLVQHPAGWGIIGAYLWKTPPFYVAASFPVLQRISRRWDDLALLFGAGRLRFFWEAVLPLLAPSLSAAFLIVFVYIFSSYEAPYVLGSGRPRFLSVYIYQIYARGDLSSRPLLMALNSLTALFSLAAGAALFGLNRRLSRDLGGWDA